MTDVRLTDQDREDLLKFLDDYSSKVSNEDIDEIERKISKKINILRHKKKVPSFVEKMLPQAEELAKLWKSPKTPENMRNKIIAALHYFILAEDKIPDYLPVIGYIDDAYIISIVYREVRKYKQ